MRLRSLRGSIRSARIISGPGTPHENPCQALARETEAFVIVADDAIGRGGVVPPNTFPRDPGGWYYLCRSRDLT